jgi:cell division septal protein FtsQ
VNRSAIASPHALHFQRGEGKARLKKDPWRMPARLRQILLTVGLAALSFFALYEIFLFVISWNNLDVKDVQVFCADAAVKSEVARMVGNVRWGNILLLNLSRIRSRIESYPWVKETRLRKVFPASVKIEVTPRVPVALLQGDGLVPIDGERVELGRAVREDYPGLPVLFDAGGFREDRRDKLDLAWSCLADLSAAEKADVEILDLSDPNDVILKFRSDPTRLKLGDGLFARKIAFYRENRSRLANESGPPEFADLRITDRIYFVPAGSIKRGQGITQPDKERR